jgi:RimJ/RimL family protein N-acetyltransferase
MEPTVQQAVRGVRLEPWGEDDFWLLERANAPEMTTYLGGPETEEQVLSRHRKYVENDFPGQMFVVILADGERVGSIGYWQHEQPGGSTVWEAGWGVLPEFQGRGIAAAAITELIEVAAAARSHRTLHAYPRIDNPASNALCRKAGFTLGAEIDLEYPKGNPIRCNDWYVDLHVVRCSQVSSV